MQQRKQHRLREALREGVLANWRSDHGCPDTERLCAHVDGTLSKKDPSAAAAVAQHLKSCPICSLEAKRIQKTMKTANSFWLDLLIFLRRPAARMTFQAAGGIAAVGLLVWIATLPMRLSQQRTNDALQQQISGIRVDLRTHLARLEKSNEKILAALENQPVSSPQVKYALYDGDRLVTSDQQGNVGGLPSLPPSLEREVKATLRTEAVKKPLVLDEVVGTGSKFMGTSGSGVPFALLYPVGKVITNDRPTFGWKPFPGATSYIVKVIRESDFKPQTESESLPETATEWTPSESLPGGVYRWEVTAIKDGKEVTSPESPPAPLAKFKVLDKKKKDELERAKQTYKSHLALGVLYVEAGLLDDAEREFKALLDANPKSSVAQKLLRSVRALQRPNPYLPSPTKTNPAQ